MGVNPSDANLSPPEHHLDLVAAYAVDAVDADDALVVEAGLAADARLAGAEQALRLAGGAFATAVLDADPTAAGAPADLAARVRAAALAARPGHPALAATALDTFWIESERFAATVRRLTPAQWAAPVDPPEFAGWTVHDLAAHVTATQALFAQLLGGDPGVPETDNSNDARTAEVQARHRAMDPSGTVAEYERATATAVEALRGRDEAAFEVDLDWWGTPMRVSTVCLHRSFETWTHHDDLRRAVGLPGLPPPASSLAAMSTRASEWTPLFLAASDAAVDGEIAVLDLTGPGGGRHVVDLGFTPLDPAVRATAEPRFTLQMDVTDFCRAIGRRVPDGGYAFQADGDTELAATLVANLPALAGL